MAYGFNPEKMTQEDAKAATTDVRKTLSHVVALSDVGVSLKSTYEKVLSGK